MRAFSIASFQYLRLLARALVYRGARATRKGVSFQNICFKRKFMCHHHHYHHHHHNDRLWATINHYEDMTIHYD